MPGAAVACEIVWVAGSGPLAGGPSACWDLGFIRPLFWLVVVAVVGHHSFMAAGCVDDMTFAWVSKSFSLCLASFSRLGERERGFCPAKGVCTLCTPVHAGWITLQLGSFSGSFSVDTTSCVRTQPAT